LIVIAGVAAFFAIGAIVAPDLLSGFSEEDFSFLTLATILVLALVVVILVIVTNIYRHNSLIITDKETIQVLQRGVFQVKVSHLSHADIEDITAEQNGLMPTLFNFGTLHIETSGELKNFAFTYCPDPTRYARIVLDARQSFNETPSG
jgi:signal transduction histidine kinase